MHAPESPRPTLSALALLASLLAAAVDPLPRDGAAASAPALAESRFSPTQTARDLKILKRALLALHPGLYKYQTPAQFDSVMIDAETRLAGGGSRADVFLTVTRVAAAVRCGHTWTNPYNQAPAVQTELFKRADKLPLRLELVEDRFLVTASAAPGIGAGDELVAVDGVPAADIVRRVMPLVRADGGSDGKRRAQFSHLFDLSAMDLYWPLLHPPADSAYRLEVRQHGARGTVERRVSALTPGARDSLLMAAGFKPPGDRWMLDVASGLATMTIPTFVVRDDTFDWKVWLRDAFTSLRAEHVETLILDIRANEGGDGEAADSLLTGILKRPFTTPAVRPESAYERAPYVLMRFIDTWDYDFFDRTGQAEKTTGRNWLLKSRVSEGDTLRPAAWAFGGRVFLLVGPVNSSAGYVMARRAQESGAATLVGQVTGGNRRGLNGGELCWVTLPNSGVAVDIPLISWVPTTPEPDASVTPDIVVPHRFADRQRGIDPDREAVRKLVRSVARSSGQPNH